MRVLELSEHHLSILQAVLAPYRERLAGVSVFGSRVTGRARPNSDIDLVFFGDVDEDDRSNILTDLDESDLPVTVDMVMYAKLTNAVLRDHIDRLSLPLPLHPGLDEPAADAAT